MNSRIPGLAERILTLFFGRDFVHLEGVHFVYCYAYRRTYDEWAFLSWLPRWSDKLSDYHLQSSEYRYRGVGVRRVPGLVGGVDAMATRAGADFAGLVGQPVALAHDFSAAPVGELMSHRPARGQKAGLRSVIAQTRAPGRPSHVWRVESDGGG